MRADGHDEADSRFSQFCAKRLKRKNISIFVTHVTAQAGPTARSVCSSGTASTDCRIGFVAQQNAGAVHLNEERQDPQEIKWPLYKSLRFVRLSFFCITQPKPFAVSPASTEEISLSLTHSHKTQQQLHLRVNRNQESTKRKTTKAGNERVGMYCSSSNYSTKRNINKAGEERIPIFRIIRRN